MSLYLPNSPVIKDAREKGLALLRQVGLAERADFSRPNCRVVNNNAWRLLEHLSPNPEILFADEPSANLDANTGEMVENLLFDLNQQQGTTLVLVTHKASLADRCQAQWNNAKRSLNAVNRFRSRACTLTLPGGCFGGS